MSRRHAVFRAKLGRAGCIPFPDGWDSMKLYMAMKRDMGPRRARKARFIRAWALRCRILRSWTK